MSNKKRMGSKDSATSHALLDAVEDILREEGYAAATSRRIAELAGTTQQLVYYYFNTIDEVLLAAYQRRVARGLVRLEEDIASGKPVHAMWTDQFNSTDSRLTFEYMALANRHQGIREETAAYLSKSRALQAAAIDKAISEKGLPRDPVTPEAAAFLIQAISLLLCREADSGVVAGHRDIESLVAWALRKFD